MRRLSTAQLLELGASMSDRERSLIQTMARLKLVSHRQLGALLRPDDDTPAAARDVRRFLARLTELRIFARLDRRVGGLRAGSSGFVYYLGPVGQRLVAYWQGRGLVRGRLRPEPGSRHVRHHLAVSQAYVDLWLAQRRGELELLAFDAEPACWRRSLDELGGSRWLKPDAYLRLGLGAYEDRWFVEVDLGTESRLVIRSKLKAYLDYVHTGIEQVEHGVFPRILLLTNSGERQQVLVDECTRLPEEHWPLFVVNRLEAAVGVVLGAIDDAAGQEPVPGVSR